ncbi:GNAT family N-acetyltransferase [Sphingobium algorifonticola]|uniref:N-acetyltransferase n=1 Tax=Sphingobium algorifonticola TaxID=2008318 RepID=A0A437J9T2_9SPHN|nr:GNAT family protein [Sphingobium algorifonticola]RVT42143.1 N-acetyltransferase [Sphingobium algorifonticola]
MFARTDRLLLRPGWMEDAPALAQAINDPAVLRNLEHPPAPYRLADAEAFLSRTQDAHLPNFLIFARTKGAPRLIGVCGIHGGAEAGTLELGYWIARPYWGLGFATEAGRAVMQIARATGLSKIASGHFADNRASGHVLRKLGFRETGRIVPRYSVARGETVPCVLFEMDEDADMSRKDVALELYDDEAPPLAA